MSTRFVYFDLGNVLVTFDHAQMCDQLATQLDRTPDQVSGVLFDSGLQNRYETGLVTSSEFAAEINLALQCDGAEHEIIESVSAIFQPNEPILAALTLLRRARVPMGILSNTCSGHWEWILRQRWPMLESWFEQTVLSYEIGCMKPDEGIYAACEQRVSCDASQIFFTDDRQENIDAARERGWTAHLFKNAEQLQEDLKSWLA